MTTVIDYPNFKVVPDNIEKQPQDVLALAAELRILLVRHNDILKEEGVRREMQQLEHWLEIGHKGPAPDSIISEGGICWLIGLRDRLKLSADEAIRLEGEGGNPSTKEQIEKTENILKTVRRIDRIIEENSATKTH